MAFQGLQGLGGPINYYDMIPDFRREALMETKNRVGQQAVIESQMKNAQAQKANQRRDDFYEAIQSATPEQLPALRRQFPEFAENIQAEIGVQDAEHAKFVNKALNNISLARSSGNPQLMQEAILKSAPALASMNMTTDQALQLLQSDPQRFDGLLKGAQLATLPYDKQIDVQQNQQRIDETIRSNRAAESIQIRGQNISAQNAALSREIQRAEVQDKVLDRQIARETNQLRLEELKQKQIEVQSKAASARADRQAAAQGAVDTFTTALDSLGEIENSPGLGKAVGFSSAFPTIPGTDAANFEARLDTFKAQTFLPMVQSLKGMGALSDAEGKKLSDAVGALNPKMSEKAFRDSISKIRTQLESKLGTVKRQFNYQEPAPPVQQQPTQQTTGYSSLWGD